MSLPKTAHEFMEWAWPRIEPYYDELAARPLSASSVPGWLADWTRLVDLISESHARLRLASVRDTTDQEAEQRYGTFLDTIQPAAEAADQKLKQKLLDSGLEPPGFEIALRNMRAEAGLFCEANLPLLTDERKLALEYAKIVSVQTVQWQGQELTLQQLQPVYHEPGRARRERAWRLAAERQLADRQAINDVWGRLLDVRRQLAANAGLPDYRAFRWGQMLRFDYTPADCVQFQQAIEQVVVPAAARIYDRRRRQLGVETLRPWDLDVDALGRPPLRPFSTVDELESKAAAMFERVDPQLGQYFDVMRREGLLDLGNRKGKGPGAHCTSFDAAQRPFIFANAVGLGRDVQTVLHEAGHAFHAFESIHLPYCQQRDAPMEFSEVASMAMELLAAPYLPASQGGFYAEPDAARARAEHLEQIVLFWPYMAVVDAFQHWAYENVEAASQPANCDAQWSKLWQRFMPGVDWSGLDEVMMTGWHRKLHIYRYPFYYVEYGLAQLGAVQVWHNALQDQAGAVARYRQALSLGGTRPLPELYAAAGARFAFDADTLRQAVALIEDTLQAL